MLAGKINDDKFIMSALGTIYRWIGIPIRVVIYIMILIYMVFTWNLLVEDTSASYDSTFKTVFSVIWLTSVVIWFLLWHVLIYKNTSEHVLAPRFKPIDKRFTKEQIESFTPKLRELLSHSHKTEEDLKVFLKENGREDEFRTGKKCNNDKPFSMSHCSTCKKGVYRLDHHCPFVNRCVHLSNNNYFLSYLIWCVIALPQNVFVMYHYSETQAYNTNLLLNQFVHWGNKAFVTTTFWYGLMELYINFKGRSFLELIGQASKGPAAPKYDIEGTWRDYHFLNFGTRNVLISLLFPWFFSSPITGLEYSFIEHNQEKEDFLQSHSQWLENLVGKKKKED